jgi:tetratricopeptide (TPR) repeat protein
MGNLISILVLSAAIMGLSGACTSISNQTEPQANMVSVENKLTELVDIKGRTFESVNEKGLRTFIPSTQVDFVFEKNRIRDLPNAVGKAYEKLAEKPADPESLKLIAYDQIIRGNPDGALAFVAIQGNKSLANDPEGLFIVGVSRLLKGEELNGKKFIERSMLNPHRSLMGLVNLGHYYSSKGANKESVQYFGSASKLEPSNLTLKLFLASSLFKSGRYLEAQKIYNEILVVDPKNPNALFNLAQTHKFGFRKFDESKKYLRKLLDEEIFDERVKIEANASFLHLKLLESGKKNQAGTGIF